MGILFPDRKLGRKVRFSLCLGRDGIEERVVLKMARASLVAQWLGIRLSMPGTRIQAMVREDPTCRGATKPVRHNY